MDDERQRKIEAGRKKLKAYKSRKKAAKITSDESDSSFSLSPILLPDNTENKTGAVEKNNDDTSEPSSISENIVISSPENDRSLQEIVISNIPGSSPEPSINSIMFKNPDINVKSLNTSIISETSFISLHALEMFENLNNNEHSQNILNEIIKNEDSLKSVLCDELSSDTIKNDVLNKSISNILLEDSNEKKDDNDREKKDRGIDDMLSGKDFIPEIDSLKEVYSSNQSTTSLGTSTDYKFYHDKSNYGSVEYQDMLTHRDEHIKQLTVALEQVLEDRNRLQNQAESFAQEIDQLKQQLVQTTAVIKKHNWNPTPLDSENETIDDKISSIVDEDKDVIDSNKKTENDVSFGEEKSDPNKPEVDEKNDGEKELQAINLSEKDTLSKLIRISDINFESESIPFEDTLSPEELDIIQDIRCKINLYIENKMQEYKKVHVLELKILEDQLESEKNEHIIEVAKLRELLTNVKSGSADIDELRKELNEKHSKEMEELRTYFEERCAEIEKHYSEEIFSQQSRKMSVDSSMCSEIESEMYPGVQCPQGGDSPAIGVDSNKTDINAMKLEIQNKYHAELEILREDYENRLDELRITNENEQSELEKKYLEQINTLKAELDEAQKYVLTQQEVANSGDFEIAEVVQSYERRLQEQIMLAKVDIISALEMQIQTLITNGCEDNEWPSELLQLREIINKESKTQHEEEIKKLKEDFEKKINRAIERERRNSIQSGEETDLKKERDSLKKVTSYLRNLLAELMKYFTKCEDELNNTLVGELLKQGIDKDLSRIDADLNDSFNSNASTNLESSTLSTATKIKRVHFTPDVTGIITLIDETNKDDPNSTKDISLEFQTELASCLERLKSEANAILLSTCALKSKPLDISSTDESTCKNVEDKLTSLTRKLITEKQSKNDLSLQLENAKEYIQNLETDKASLEGQLEQLTSKQIHLVTELDKAKEKIMDLVESGRKEIVSEGYGENHIAGTTLGERIATFTELQNKARNLISEGPSNSPLLNLVDDLCREGDRIMEDAKKDHEDLVQQIEAADKKLRATTQFLEDQAVDREIERDEAQKEIAALREQLKKGEQNQDNCERINREVEHLEAQMREMTNLISETENKKTLVEGELKEAIDKIWVLRDIIRDLEAQIDEKNKTEKDLVKINEQLQEKIKEHLKYNEDLCAELDSFKNRGDNGYSSQKILELEDELCRLRINSELAGSDGTVKKIKCQLNEIEKLIDKRTKDLESLHTCSGTTSYSSPSTEDMSLRDQLNRQLPSGDSLDTDLPLEQLARLKDKLIRHSRAEDAAMKRIRDLEMQLFSTKHDYELVQNEKECIQEELAEQENLITQLQLQIKDLKKQDASNFMSLENHMVQLEFENKKLKENLTECHKEIVKLNDQLQTKYYSSQCNCKDLEVLLNATRDDNEILQKEKEVLQEQLSEQMHLISSLQLRLDEQRYRIESVQKQSSCALEHKIYELENEVKDLTEKVQTRDKNIKQLNTIIDQTKSRLAEQQKQLNAASDADKEIINELKRDIEVVNMENTLLKTKINEMKYQQGHSTPDIPELLDSMLSEKNADIDRLKMQISNLKTTLEEYKMSESDINHHPQMAELKKQLNAYKNLNLSAEQIRQLNSSFNHSFTNSLGYGDYEPDQIRREEESVESVRFNNLLQVPQKSAFAGSSFRDSKYHENIKHSPFTCSHSVIEKESFRPRSLSLTLEDSALCCNRNPANERHVHFKIEETPQLNISNVMMENLKEMRRKLEFSESTLNETKKSYEEEIKHLKDIEEQLQNELKETKLINELKDKKIRNLEENLNKTVDEIDEKINIIKKYEEQLMKNNEDITKLENQLKETNNYVSKVKNLQELIDSLEQDMRKLQENSVSLESNLKTKDNEYNKLQKEYNEMKITLNKKDELLSKYEKDIENLKYRGEELKTRMQNLEDGNSEKEKLVQKIKDLEALLVKKQAELNRETDKLCTHCKNLEEQVRTLEEKHMTELQSLENKSKMIASDKDMIISKNESFIEELRKEVNHLQDFINQKDKIINQMTKDSNSLHKSLEAIQSKMQECGNVVDLKKRLRDEQNLTSALHDEIQFLKQRVCELENNLSMDDDSYSNSKLKIKYQKECEANAELLKLRDNLIHELQNLEERLQYERDNITRLQLLLDAEKQNSNTIQLQDANIIETMRTRLEQSLRHETELEKLLECERQLNQNYKIVSTGTRSLDSSIQKDTSFELTCIKMDLVKAKTENDILKSEISTLNNVNTILKNELEELKHVNELQTQEINSIKTKIAEMKDSESSLKNSLKYKERELEQKNNEIDNNRVLMNELEKEKDAIKNEIYCLQSNEKQRSLDGFNDDMFNQPVPERFLFKMKELTTLLHEHVAENSHLSSLILQLKEEKKRLLTKNNELEVICHAKNLPFTDSAMRADHLFGCYLKAESYRKALIFQKRYLLTLLASYQSCSSRLVDLQLIYAKSDLQSCARTGIRKFRSVVYLVIAISRMKFVVRRWKTGLRKGSSMATNFVCKSNTNVNDKNSKPMYGNSPPSKDRSNRNNDKPLGNLIKDSIHLSPLQAPQLLSQYIERFDNIQQGLGLVPNQSST